jgi:hypothetical protein
MSFAIDATDQPVMGFGPGAAVRDVFIVRDASAVLAIRNGTVAPQVLRVYETFTDSSNYSRSTITTQSGSHLIRTEAAGTGTLRSLIVGSGATSGTDIAGVSVVLHGGQSTGTGLPGAILFQQSTPAGGTGSGVNALATRWSISTAGYLTGAAGFAISLASGTNTRAGNATLVAGTVTVNNTTVTANTIVILTRKTSGGTIGTAITYTLSAGTSFTITSDSVLDTSTFSYVLFENP